MDLWQLAAADLRVDCRGARQRHALLEVSADESADLAAGRVRPLAERAHAEERAAGEVRSHDCEAGTHADAEREAQELRAPRSITAAVSHAFRLRSFVAPGPPDRRPPVVDV